MDFETAIQALTDAGVEFVVIGGVSATLHGSAQVTYDLDICYSRVTGNLRKLVTALAPFRPRPRGFPANLPFVWDETMLRNATAMTLSTDLGDIDLLAEVAGVGGFSEALACSVTFNAFGRKIQTLNISSLINAKRAAGRDKDLPTLRELESLVEAKDASSVQKLNDSPK